MQLRGLSFQSPRYSKETGYVIGHEARTVIDLAVWVPGRLVFCSKPDLRAAGYYLADPDVKIVNPDGGKLDVSNITFPSTADLHQLREATGQKLSYSKQGIIGFGPHEWKDRSRCLCSGRLGTPH